MPADRSAQPRPAGLITSILPSAVAAAESIGDAPGAGPVLFPAEETLLRTADPRRRAEFTVGRLCARAALAELGVPAAPLLPGRAGQPRWPAGVTGSITHTTGYRACAVARCAEVAAIGIDAEPNQPLPGGLIEAVATGPERTRIRRLAAAVPAVCWDRLLFSAKEALAKLWYPATGQWLACHDAAIVPARAGTFSARLAAPGPSVSGMTGRWLVRDGLIITAVTWAPATASAGGTPAVQDA